MPRSSHECLRDLLLVLLGFTTGATDATAFERLGHVFSSVITGNVVVLGVATARGDGQLALLSGCALGGYALGVLVSAPRTRERAGSKLLWPAGTGAALGVDLALLAVFAVGWELSSQRPGRTMEVLLLALAGSAMGAQSTAVRRLGGMSTTYLTGTLTGLIEAAVVRRWPRENTRSLGIVLMALAGAAAATAVIVNAAAWLPVLELCPLTVVLTASRPLVGVGAT